MVSYKTHAIKGEEMEVPSDPASVLPSRGGARQEACLYVASWRGVCVACSRRLRVGQGNSLDGSLEAQPSPLLSSPHRKEGCRDTVGRPSRKAHRETVR